MAVVYVAQDQRYGRNVAIKVLRPDVEGRSLRDLIDRERQLDIATTVRIAEEIEAEPQQRPFVKEHLWFRPLREHPQFVRMTGGGGG